MPRGETRAPPAASTPRLRERPYESVHPDSSYKIFPQKSQSQIFRYQFFLMYLDFGVAITTARQLEPN